MTTLSTQFCRSNFPMSDATSLIGAPPNDTLNVRVFETLVRKKRTTSPRSTVRR